MRSLTRASATPSGVRDPGEGPTSRALPPTWWRRLRRHRAGLVGGVITLLVCGMALAAPWLGSRDPYRLEPSARLELPSVGHPFGRDALGRDILARVIYGARISLGVGVLSVLVGCAAGMMLGGFGGYFGGWSDEMVMRVLDVVLAFPSIFLGLAIVSVLGPSLWNVAMAVGLVSVPRFARVVRSVVLSLREREFILAAVATGGSHRWIFLRHIVPNLLPPVMVMVTLYIGTSLITASSLSFLGMGVQPPTPEWGNMLAEAREFIVVAPHVGLFPGLAITLTVMGLNMLGDGLRDAFDPRLT